MLKKISLELVNVISERLMILKNKNGTVEIIDDCGDLLGAVVFKSDESHLMEECKEWLRIINIYFKTSYRAYSLKKAGRFNVIRPYKIGNNFVRFTIENVDLVDNWENWFVMEGELYAS